MPAIQSSDPVQKSQPDRFESMIKATACVEGFYFDICGPFAATKFCKAIEFSHSAAFLLGDKLAYNKALDARKLAFEVYEFERSEKNPYDDPYVQKVLGSNESDTAADFVTLGISTLAKLVKELSDADNQTSDYLAGGKAAMIALFFGQLGYLVYKKKTKKRFKFAMLCMMAISGVAAWRVWELEHGFKEKEQFIRWVSGSSGGIPQTNWLDKARWKELFPDKNYAVHADELRKTMDLSLIGAYGTNNTRTDWKEAAKAWMGSSSGYSKAMSISSRINAISEVNALGNDEGSQQEEILYFAAGAMLWILMGCMAYMTSSPLEEKKSATVTLAEMKIRPGTENYIPDMLSMQLNELSQKSDETKAKYDVWYDEDFEERGRGSEATSKWKLDVLERKAGELENTTTKGQTFDALKEELDQLVYDHLDALDDRSFFASFAGEREFENEFNKKYAWMTFLLADFEDFLKNQSIGGAPIRNIPARRANKSPPRLRPVRSSMVDIVFARHGL